MFYLFQHPYFLFGFHQFSVAVKNVWGGMFFTSSLRMWGGYQHIAELWGNPVVILNIVTVSKRWIFETWQNFLRNIRWIILIKTARAEVHIVSLHAAAFPNFAQAHSVLLLGEKVDSVFLDNEASIEMIIFENVMTWNHNNIDSYNRTSFFRTICRSCKSWQEVFKIVPRIWWRWNQGTRQKLFKSDRCRVCSCRQWTRRLWALTRNRREARKWGQIVMGTVQWQWRSQVLNFQTDIPNLLSSN